MNTQKLFNTLDKLFKGLIAISVTAFSISFVSVCFLLAFEPCNNGICIANPTFATEVECNETFTDEIAYYKEKYNLDLEFKFSPDGYMASEEAGYSYENEATIEYAKILLEQLDDALMNYSDETIASLPRTIIITSGIAHEDYSVYGYVSSIDKESLLICFSTELYKNYKNAEEVINHEIFHVITNRWEQDEFDKFFEVEGSCSEISEYACTNDKEELSETWAYSFKEADNERANYLKEEYGYLLRG